MSSPWYLFVATALHTRWCLFRSDALANGCVETADVTHPRKVKLATVCAETRPHELTTKPLQSYLVNGSLSNIYLVARRNEAGVNHPNTPTCRAGGLEVPRKH